MTEKITKSGRPALSKEEKEVVFRKLEPYLRVITTSGVV